MTPATTCKRPHTIEEIKTEVQNLSRQNTEQEAQADLWQPTEKLGSGAERRNYLGGNGFREQRLQIEQETTKVGPAKNANCNEKCVARQTTNPEQVTSDPSAIPDTRPNSKS
jgi:hypothetical protein